MENLDKEYRIAQLISKEVWGDITSEEKAAIESWLQESTDNQMLYQMILEGEKRTERDTFVERINIPKAWNKIKPEIAPQSKVLHVKEWALRVAAVFLVALLAGALYFVSTEKDTTTPKLAQQTIQPGSSKAILLMDGGKVIQLEVPGNDSIVEADGTLLQNVNGKLAYVDMGNVVDLKTIYNTVKVPRGGEYRLILSDGTEVWLNSDSEIKYPVQFTGNTRKVQINGEVYFDVKIDKSKPFIVSVKDIEVEVLGTEFNIEAYREDAFISTTLVEGSVRLTKGKEEIVLKPNQQAVIQDKEKMFSIYDVDARAHALWKEGIIYCENERLEVIMDKLGRWYDVNLFYMNPSVKNKRFNIEVKRYENIHKVLEILAATDKVRFETNLNNITIKE